MQDFQVIVIGVTPRGRLSALASDVNRAVTIEFSEIDFVGRDHELFLPQETLYWLKDTLDNQIITVNLIPGNNPLSFHWKGECLLENDEISVNLQLIKKGFAIIRLTEI